MPPVRALLGVVGVSLVLAASASEAGTAAVRSSPHAVVVHPNRAVVGASVVVRPEPSVFPRPVDPWRFWPPGTLVTRHGGVPFGSSLVLPSYPAIIGSGPALAVSAPYVYDQTPVVTGGAAPVTTVIEYPAGWYQLRGDGLTSPYVWVWIPKPPPAPSQPAAVIPPVPPPPVGSVLPDSTADVSPRRKGLFRWIDDEGVAHWTDQRESIPQRYRAKAESR